MTKLTFAAVITALSTTIGPAYAAEFTPEMDTALQTCIDTALRQHAGIVTQWEMDSRTSALGIKLDVVASDDQVWSMKCEGGAIVSDERKMGNKNYKMLSSRVKVPETTTRRTAVEEYPATELTRMQYSLSWKGSPYFNYTFMTADAREATVEVNAVTGKIDRTYSSRVD
jgi:uncharacterized membrane protein YkoI